MCAYSQFHYKKKKKKKKKKKNPIWSDMEMNDCFTMQNSCLNIHYD